MKILPNSYNGIYFKCKWSPEISWYLKRIENNLFYTYHIDNGEISIFEREYEINQIKERFKVGDWIRIS